MAISKEFQNQAFRDDFLKAAALKRYVKRCPSCGASVHIDRAYCACHTNVTWLSFGPSALPPEVDECNIDESGFTCNDCENVKNCKVCASFGRNAKNPQGFGGKDCVYKSETARCICCQAEIKKAETMFQNQTAV
jgi:hypothetical protein